MKRIHIIDDDLDMVKLVSTILQPEGFNVAWSSEGSAGLIGIRKSPPDILVLDVMLGDMNGLEILKEIRRDPKLSGLPILLLTAKGSETDRVVGLELGADDYVVKPFSSAELSARVKALLRRAAPPALEAQPVQAGELRLDPASLRITRTGKLLPASALEFRLLYFLASQPNKVFTRDQLLNGIWGEGHFVTPRIVDVYIRQLREKIEKNPDRPQFLKTVRGAGYMFEFQML